MAHPTLKPRRLLHTIALALTVGMSGTPHASEGELIQILPSVDNAKWRTECAGCHTLFHPALLPERSWRKLMSGLDQHFGKRLTLDAAANKELTEFLAANAAEHTRNNRAEKIAKTTQQGQIPLRVTETAYFKLHHHEIGAEVWQRKAIGSKINCSACHPDAERNNFDENAIRIPR